MPGFTRHVVEVTTDGSGNATAYSSPITGLLHAIRYKKASSGNFSDGVDFAIVGRDTSQGIWTETNVNASALRYPRAANHGVGDGAALTGIYDKILLMDEQVQIGIASGGDTKSGTFELIVEDL